MMSASASSAPANDEASGSMWLPCDDISERYPRLEGTLLQARVDMDYVMEGIFTIPWFTAKGDPTLRRHPANDRGDEVTIEEIAQSIEERGYCEGVSSSPVIVPESAAPDNEKFLVMGGAHRCCIQASMANIRISRL
jgi:hypothetical protein